MLSIIGLRKKENRTRLKSHSASQTIKKLEIRVCQENCNWCISSLQCSSYSKLQNGGIMITSTLLSVLSLFLARPLELSYLTLMSVLTL